MASASAAAAPSTTTNRMPTHFVALRVENPAMLERVAAIQRAVCSREEKEQDDDAQDESLLLRHCCYPVAKFHFSLSVMRLEDAEEVDACKRVLGAWFDDWLSRTPYSEPVVELERLEAFSNKVLFSAPDRASEESVLLPLAATLNTALLEGGILGGDGYRFAAHATIMKTSMAASRQRSRGKRPPKAAIPRRFWEGLDGRLGPVRFEKVQLLDMRRPSSDGYYEADWEGEFPTMEHFTNAPDSSGSSSGGSGGSSSSSSSSGSSGSCSGGGGGGKGLGKGLGKGAAKGLGKGKGGGKGGSGRGKGKGDGHSHEHDFIGSSPHASFGQGRGGGHHHTHHHGSHGGGES